MNSYNHSPETGFVHCVNLAGTIEKCHTDSRMMIDMIDVLCSAEKHELVKKKIQHSALVLRFWKSGKALELLLWLNFEFPN